MLGSVRDVDDLLRRCYYFKANCTGKIFRVYVEITCNVPYPFRKSSLAFLSFALVELDLWPSLSHK